MRLISIEQLKPTMVLAADVHSRTGRLLAAAGIQVTDQHLLAFRTWGVLEVEIVTDNDDENAADNSAAPDEERIEAAIISLLPHFRLNDVAHPLIAELLRLAAARKAIEHES